MVLYENGLLTSVFCLSAPLTPPTAYLSETEDVGEPYFFPPSFTINVTGNLF